MDIKIDLTLVRKAFDSQVSGKQTSVLRYFDTVFLQQPKKKIQLVYTN
jgi:hypothetical protein